LPKYAHTVRREGTIHRGTPRLLARLLATLCVPLLAVGLLAAPLATDAGATMDPHLEQYIVQNHLRGWVAEPASSMLDLVTYQDRVVDAAIGGAGLTAQGAAKGWHALGLTSNVVIIDLTATFRTTGDTSVFQVPERTVAVAAETACESATGASPVSIIPIPAVPGSRLATCKTKSGDAFPPTVAAFKRANVLGMVFTKNVTTVTAVDAVKAQYRALPSGGVAAASSDTGLVVAVVVAVVVLCGGVVLLVVVRRRRRSEVAVPWTYPTTVAAPPPPGWYPDPANPGGSRYWTGGGWGPPAPASPPMTYPGAPPASSGPGQPASSAGYPTASNPPAASVPSTGDESAATPPDVGSAREPGTDGGA
jgi:hypothetical protein